VGNNATGWPFCRSSASDTPALAEEDNKATAMQTSDKMRIAVFISGLFIFLN
jgi:hypothetical protein